MLLGKTKSALLIDYDNVTPFFRNEKLSGRIGNWLSWLEDGQFDPQRRRRNFLLKKVFWHKRYADEQPAFEHYEFKTETCVYAAGGKQGQSAVDLHLAMDAIEVAHDLNGLREMIILASDSDYLPLIERLKAKGLQTAIVVSERDASRIYNGKADLTITEDHLRAALSYVRARRAAPLRPAPKSEPVAAKPPPGFDLDKAAAIVAQLVVGRRDKRAGLRDVATAIQSEPAFKGDRTWLGMGTFEAFANEMARRKGTLRVTRTSTGGIGIEHTGFTSEQPSAA
ncbi:MAG: NYN domain-containing protein [Vitreimonas sp.]